MPFVKINQLIYHSAARPTSEKRATFASLFCPLSYRKKVSLQNLVYIKTISKGLIRSMLILCTFAFPATSVNAVSTNKK